MTQKFSNSSPALNFLGAELAVVVKVSGCLTSIPCTYPEQGGRRSFSPRLMGATTLPAALEGITIETPEQRTISWYHLRPPGSDSTEWPDSDV